MEYSQNYSYQGMNNVANMADGGPVSMGDAGMADANGQHHHPRNNNQDTASLISGMSESTVRPMNGATARDGGPYPPQQGGYRPYGGQGMPQHPQQQQQPPIYTSTVWNPNQQQQQHNQAGPVATGPGTEASEYESVVSGAPPYGNRPPTRMHRPPYNGHNGGPPNQAYGGRPPPPHTSGYDSDSSDGYTATTGAGARERNDVSKFSFLNSLKDSLKYLEITDILPVAGMLAAGLYHYYTNRSSKKPSPYKNPSWMQYMATAAPLAQIAFEQIGKKGKHGRPGASGFGGSTFGGGGRYGGGHSSGGGLGSAIPWTALIGTLAGTMMNSGGHSNRPHGGRPNGYGHSGYGGRPSMNPSGAYSSYGGGRPSIGGYSPSQFGGTNAGGGGGDMISKMMGKIMGGLFKGNQSGGHGTRDLESSDRNVLKDFDDSLAVQRFVAEHYYRHVYRKNMDLRNASAKTLGGAAAIRALREEDRMSVMLTPDDPSVPKDLPYDQIVMGMALSEVSNLLDRKAEAGPLHEEENMEFIGKIALATIIKIKMDEEQGEPRKSHSEHRFNALENQRSSSRDHRNSYSEHHRSSRNHHGSSSEHRSSRDHHHSSSDPARKHKSSSSSSRHQSSSESGHRHGSSESGHRHGSSESGHRHGSSESGHRHGSSESGRHHRSSRHDYERSSRHKDPSDAKDKYHSRPVDPYSH